MNERLLEDFRAKLSGLLVVGLILGLAYLTVLLAGPKLFPEPFEIFSARLTPLEAGGEEFSPCAQQPVTPRQQVDAVETGPRNRITLHEINTTQLPGLGDSVIFLTTRSDDARLHLCDGSGQAVTTYYSGDAVPASRQPLQTAEVAFPLSLGSPDEAGLRYVLETRQPALLITPVKIMAAEAFHTRSRQTLMTRLFFFGGILSLVGYNLILGWLVGQWTYLFNALNTLSILFLDFYLTGVGPAYLWPEQPWLSNKVMVLSEAGPGIFAVLFAYHFLHPGDWRGLARRPVFYIWPLLNMIILACWVFLSYWQAALGVIAVWIAAAIAMIVVLVARARQGNERAQILLVPVVAVIVPSMIAGIAQQFTGWNLGRIGAHHAEITLVFEALLFTLTLAYLLTVTERERQAERRARIEVAERSKQQLLQRVDRERSRIAAELHDSAGQGLVTIVSRLRRAGRNGTGGKAGAVLQDVERETRYLLDDIRRISHDLHPAALDHLGLAGALKELRSRLAKSGDVRILLDVEPALELDRNQQLQVYRVVQELVSNALRHSGGDLINIQLTGESGKVIVEVGDNGTAGSAVNGEGIGLAVVDERAAILGGRFTIKQSPEGTRARLTFPASRPESRPESRKAQS